MFCIGSTLLKRFDGMYSYYGSMHVIFDYTKPMQQNMCNHLQVIMLNLIWNPTKSRGH
jgi:hypothetical protein